MKRLLLAVLFGTLATCALAATSAWADTPNPDTSGDGRVTLPEYQDFAWAQWLTRTDRNRDGKIAKDEVAASAGAARALLDVYWGKMDTSRDNQLSRGEVDRMSAQGFQKADANRDSVLDAREIAAARNGRRRPAQ